MVDCVSQVQLSKTLAVLLSWHCVRSAAYKSKQDCPQNEQAISLALCTIHSGSEFDRQCCVTITQHEPGGSTVVCQTASGEWQQALLDNLKVAADASNQQIIFEACVRNDHEWLVKQSMHHGIGYMTELASQTNACEETPLHICAAHSSLDCIHVLLKIGAVTRSSINLVDRCGDTALRLIRKRLANTGQQGREFVALLACKDALVKAGAMDRKPTASLVMPAANCKGS